ncbi:alpha/beta hydrolase [Geobacillus jurassicus]|uniref:Alpha/beta hydrolase n=1 Tax=Geobacillus jurassicus TaxID=235932 RepID=A0ABV6GX81_9BACL
MWSVKYDQWIAAAEQAFLALHHRCSAVYVIGFSMGGVIAVYLAEKYPVTKLVLLSAAFYHSQPRRPPLLHVSGSGG